MNDGSRNSGIPVALGASLLSAILGSVHAFSVFLAPLETTFGVSRTSSSLTYSIALLALTIAVFVGPRIYGRWSPGVIVTASCLLGAAGAVVAAIAPVFLGVWLGYGVLFGLANGLGYGFGLQLAAHANPGREGIAMGVVTAAYALGAVSASYLFASAVSAGGFGLAMIVLATSLFLVWPVCVALLKFGGAKFIAPENPKLNARYSFGKLLGIWVGYGAGVAAGLMVIGHAAGIATAAGFQGANWLAPVVLAICNLAGSLLLGILIDRYPRVKFLIVLPVATAIGVAGLTLVGGNSLLLMLGIVGFAYGGTIAAYPAAIIKYFGAAQSPSVYGRVFTAWGAAGLMAPWIAGWLFDWQGDYQVALLVAAGFAAISVIAAIATNLMPGR
ncbi:MAG: MFS transporter [Boseongicola sp.]